MNQPITNDILYFIFQFLNTEKNILNTLPAKCTDTFYDASHLKMVNWLGNYERSLLKTKNFWLEQIEPINSGPEVTG